MRLARSGATVTYLRPHFVVEGRVDSKQVSLQSKSCSRGSGHTVFKTEIRVGVPLGSFNLTGVGSFRPGDRRNRAFDRVRVPSANPRDVNSSTMKVSQEIASESDSRRSQIVNARHRWVRGRLYLRSPESTRESRGNYARMGI
jgi:hypothetical protein